MNEKTKALLASYGRSVLGAALALYMSGVTDPKTLAYSLLGARRLTISGNFRRLGSGSTSPTS